LLKIHVVDRALSDAEMLKQISPLVYKFVGKTLEKRDAKKAAAEKRNQSRGGNPTRIVRSVECD
jgi:hypothetical protein